MSTKSQRDAARVKGKCIQCIGRSAVHGSSYCQTCKDKHTILDKRRYQKRITAGLCGGCGKKPIKQGETRCEECANKGNALIKELQIKSRKEVIAHYGNKCQCCGENNIAFLTIDHINNDGAEHRRKIKKTSIYRWLVRNNFPEGFQVLCYNCNCARQFNNGVCPHKKSD